MSEPRRIALVGFADSKRDAPWTDSSWEKWAVNDLYAHVPKDAQVHRVFEIHHLLNMGPRRNPEHHKWLAEEAPKKGIPVLMQEKREEYPTSVSFPRMQLIECFGDEAFGGRAGCDYFTNSIAWMIALALYELSEWETLPDGRRLRLCPPGSELGLWGIDMAAETEYGSQRPSCEFWLGLAKSMGVKVYVPDDSELLKAPAIYGYDTSHPLRVRLQSQMQSCREQTIQLQQQEAQLHQQLQVVRDHLNQIRGRKLTLNDLIRNWTMPTDIGTGEEKGLSKERQQPIFQLADGQQVEQVHITNGQVLAKEGA